MQGWQTDVLIRIDVLNSVRPLAQLREPLPRYDDADYQHDVRGDGFADALDDERRRRLRAHVTCFLDHAQHQSDGVDDKQERLASEKQPEDVAIGSLELLYTARHALGVHNPDAHLPEIAGVFDEVASGVRQTSLCSVSKDDAAVSGAVVVRRHRLTLALTGDETFPLAAAVHIFHSVMGPKELGHVPLLVDGSIKLRNPSDHSHDPLPIMILIWRFFVKNNK